MPDLTFRRAVREDVPQIVSLLQDDVLGAGREASASAPEYLTAFEEIDGDPNQYLCVAEIDHEIVGTLQLTFIAGLSRGGAKRGLIEAVRVAHSRRGQKIGDAMMDWAIRECRQRGCALVQLTTDKSRTDAHRFYERFGFEPSHVGYKLRLTNEP